MNNNMISTGNCGEYFVAAELERRGFTVAVPMSNVENFDILAINRQSHQQIAVQVKTTRSNRREWVLSAKSERLIGNNIFYVFVTLCGLDAPEYHIVPSAVVAASVSEDHAHWLHTPGKNGQAHNDNPVRKFRDLDNTYLDNWSILFSESVQDLL